MDSFDTKFSSSPDKSVLFMRGDDLMVLMTGAVFPKQGGAQCGNSMQELNISEHIRKLIREELAQK